MRTRYLQLSLVGAVVVFACNARHNPLADSEDLTDAGRARGSRVNGGLPCDVDDILASRCRDCHSSPSRFGAPMPLVSLSDFHAPAPSDRTKKVFEVVGVRIHDEQRPMPQPPNPRLSPSEIAVLDAWIGAGAPSRDESCEDTREDAGSSAPPRLACPADLELRPAKPWAMPKTMQDVYVCYGVDVRPTQKRHVFGISPKIDNTTIVHHILLLESETAGSSVPVPCDQNGGSNTRMVYAWAPGGEAFELPPQAGLPLDATKTNHYIVQLHYSNIGGLDGQSDASGLDLCTTDQLRPYDADMMAFGTTDITVPPRGSSDMSCSLTVPPDMQPFNVIAAFPHMHQVGKIISTTRIPAGGGAPVDLGTRNPWNFQNQSWSKISTTILPNDTILTRCRWENPSDTTILFGERTSDEMCFGFVMYYPRVTNETWTWATPVKAMTCEPTP